MYSAVSPLMSLAILLQLQRTWLLRGGDAGEDVTPERLFGPCRRATSLSATVLVPTAGRIVLTFDNSGMWISSKTIKFRARTEEDAL